MLCLDLSKVVAETYEETFQRCLSICRLYEEWCHAVAKARREVALAAQRTTYSPRIIVVDSRALHIYDDGIRLIQLAKFFDYHWPFTRHVDRGIPRYLVLPRYYWYFGGCDAPLPRIPATPITGHRLSGLSPHSWGLIPLVRRPAGPGALRFTVASPQRLHVKIVVNTHVFLPL